MRFLILLFAFSFISLSVSAQSSWEDLVRDVQTPVGAKPGNGNEHRGNGDLEIDLQAIEQLSRTQNQSRPDQEVGVKMVMRSKCENPDYPECLWDMRSRPGHVDLENCKELTKLYLSALGSYTKCIDRITRKQARNIVNYYNCYAKNGDNCPGLFAD